ncbi:hypothetical protein HPB47_011893 [Ixodes persulcatus]|uniref:Uncharacterized protein n=1 Tax=Ixodes persulcatus TaxID=34615 RepID=A0AC60NV33_IXOPE|nr:hypothetical protein HPB47_011893 [Ixodes persulcatus]
MDRGAELPAVRERAPRPPDHPCIARRFAFRTPRTDPPRENEDDGTDSCKKRRGLCAPFAALRSLHTAAFLAARNGGRRPVISVPYRRTRHTQRDPLLPGPRRAHLSVRPNAAHTAASAFETVKRSEFGRRLSGATAITRV